MATTTFNGPVVSQNGFQGDVTGKVTGGVVFPEYTVATVPAASANTGLTIFVSNGNAGAETLARSDGSSWISLTSGTAIAAA